MTYAQDVIDHALFLAQQPLPKTAPDGYPLTPLSDRTKRRHDHASGGAPSRQAPPSNNIRHRGDALAQGARHEQMIRRGYAAGGAPAAPVTVNDFMNAAGGQPAPQQQKSPSVTLQDFMANSSPLVGGSPPAAPQASGPQAPTVADFMANSSAMPGADPALTPSAKPDPGLLKSAAAGAMSGVQDVADAAKWAWTNASQPGLAELSAADDPGVKASDLIPKASAPAQIPGVTKFVQNNEPQTFGEKMAYGAGSMVPFALSQLVPGADVADDAGALTRLGKMIRDVPGLAASGAGSGAGGYEGQRFGQFVGGDEGGQIGGTVGSLVGGILPLASGYALSKTADALGDFVPLTKGMKTRQAARILAKAAPDLPAARQAVTARLTPGATIQAGNRTVPLGPNGEILPGVAPTAAQLSGSSALARLAEGLKARGYGDSLIEAEQDQEAGRAAAVRNLSPENGDTASLGDFVRRAQQQQDAKYQTQLATQNKGRDTALAQQPGASGEVAPYQAGQQFQGALSAGDQARAAATSRLFKALDDKNPTISMGPLSDTVKTISGGIAATKAGDVLPVEDSLLARAHDLAASPDTDWAQVQQFRKEVNGAIGASTDRFGQATPATRRLTMLKSGIDDATASAVDRLQQSEEVAVRSGQMAPEDTTIARFKNEAQGWNDGPSAEPGTTRQGSDPGGFASGYPARGVDRLSGLDGDQAAGEGRSGVSGRNPGLAPASPNVRQPTSLLTFLTRRGGIQDTGGDLAAMDARLQRVGLVRRNGGEGLDYAREAAEEAGYLPQGSDTNDLLEAIRTELSGRKVYPAEAGAEYEAGQRSAREADRQGEALVGAREDVHDAASEGGVQALPEEIDRAAQYVLQGAHPETALRRSIAETEQAEMLRESARDRRGPPGMPGAQQPALGLHERLQARLKGGPPPGRPSWAADDAANYKDALASHAARKGLYSNPQIGPLLAKAPGGNLALAPEEVVKQAVPTGPRGAAMARSVAATAADDPHIMSYYESIVGLDLRNAVVRDGQVSRPLLASWTRNHQGLLSEMPQVAQRLNSIDAAQEMVDQAAKSATIATDIFKTRALSSLIGGDDPAVAMQSLLNGTPQDARAFMGFVRRNPAAQAGAQQAMADLLAQKLLTPKGGLETGNEAVGIAGLRAMIKSPSKMVVLREVIGPHAPQDLRRIVDDFDLYNTAALSRLGAEGSRTTPLAYAAKDIGQPTTMLGRIMQELSRPVVDAVLAAAAHPAATIPAFLTSSAARALQLKSREAVARIVAHALADPRFFLKLTAPIPRNSTAEARFVFQLRGILANTAINSGAKQGGGSAQAN
jgi:hypothetical protein